MSDVAPVVRHMLLCEDVRTDPDNAQKVNVFGLVSTIRAVPDDAFPVHHPELCVYLQLTGGRGTGEVQIAAVQAELEQIVFTSSVHSITFENDPLSVLGFVFRIEDCIFPHAGLYWIQFRVNDQVIAQQPLLLK